jgi:hypothetical protein
MKDEREEGRGKREVLNLVHYLQIKEEYVNDKSRWVCCPVKKVIYFLFFTSDIIFLFTKI